MVSIITSRIKISGEDFETTAKLLEDKKPETCKAVWDSLPFEGKASVFKEEVYFTFPVDIELEEGSPDTEKGDVSYWPKGPAFCVFFGDSQPVSPVSTFAKIEEGVESFREVAERDSISVTKVES